MVSLGTTIQGYVGTYEWHYMINGTYFCVALLLFFFSIDISIILCCKCTQSFQKMSLTFT
jgi:hypothetical protein